MSCKKNTRLACAALALMIAASSAPVLAATATGSLTISASVLSTCSLTGGSIPFGTYGTTQVDQTGTLSVQCTNGVPYTVSLGAGAGTGATTSARKMTGTTNAGLLNYALYRDSGRTNNWGNTISTDTLAGTGSGVSQSVTVYGRIPAGQTPSVDTYSDTVVVTLTY